MFYEEQSSRELEKVMNNVEWWKLLKKKNFIEKVISGRCLQGV